jgi:hypothetical protein
MTKLAQLGWNGLTRGEIYGVRVSRNPIAWISFFLLLAVVFVICIVVMVVWIMSLPLVLTLAYFGIRSFEKKAGVFSDTGIYFPKAYDNIKIAWNEIREVVRIREPKALFYRVVCHGAPENTKGYVMSSTQDDDAFERTLVEKGIPFENRDWIDDRTGGRDA